MGLLTMNEQERLAKALMEMVAQKKLKLGRAAIQLGVSYRQAKRIYRRYKAEGDAGLVHKARGRESSYRHPHREAIITRYKERYEGFGPTLAAEYLEEDGFKIDHETLRRYLISEELWCKQRHRSPYRRYRECKAQFGELVQMDGSIHDWLEEGRHRCLLNMVDDATGKTLSHLESGETTRSIFIVIWKWIKRYGIPLAFYVDLKNVYISPKDTSFSHVERACMKLGIRIIKAHSAQAKGRVERNHAVYQDRLVKDLRLKKIKTIEEANEVLDGGFVDKLNQKFEKPARNPESAHRDLNGIDLNQILCWEYRRQIQNDWCFSFRNQCYQIKKSYGDTVRPKVDIFVRKHLDGSVSAWYKEKRLEITALAERPKAIKAKSPIKNVISMSERGRLGKQKSPWNSTNGDFFKIPNNPSAIVSKAYTASRRFSNKIVGS